MKKFFLIILGLSLISCKKTEKNSSISPQEDKTIETQKAPQVKNTLEIGLINGFPNEVSGCSCYFSDKNKTINSPEKKIYYVDDYQKTAFVKINNKLEKLNITDDIRPTENSLQKNFSNENYEGKILLDKIPSKIYENEGNELWFYKGVLEITDKKTGQKTSVSIHGECGC